MSKTFINPPLTIGREIYHKAYQELRDYFLKLEDVSSLYEYGFIHTPGISDVDIFVVTHGDLKDSTSSSYDIDVKRFPALSVLPRGTLMVMAKSEFRDIHWFDDDIYLKQLAGKKIITSEINPEMRIHRRIASVIDWLPERVGYLLRLYLRSEIDITLSLRTLRSYCYTLDKLGAIRGVQSHQDFIAEVVQLRNTWSQEKEAKLYELLEKGIVLGFTALKEFSNDFLLEESKGVGSLFLFKDLQYIFTDDDAIITPSYAIKSSLPGRIVVPLPSYFASHFSFYSQQPGFLARQMQKQISLPLLEPRKEQYRYFLERKMELATRSALFLLRNKFKTGLFRFGFYFQNYLEYVKNASRVDEA